MAHAASYITRRGAKYHYRRRVPADVQFGLFFKGRADYRESLRTSDLKEAKRRAIVVDLRFEAEVANMRPSPISAVGVLAPGVDYVLTQADTEAITAAHWATSDEIDRENRRQADLDPEGDWAHHLALLWQIIFERCPAVWTSMRGRFEQAIQDGLSDRGKAWLRGWA